MLQMLVLLSKFIFLYINNMSKDIIDSEISYKPAYIRVSNLHFIIAYKYTNTYSQLLLSQLGVDGIQLVP